MTVASVSDVSSLTLTDSLNAVGKKELDRNDFMNLFITQLQYQDPMKPMDSYEMASQLAQFSSMEATMKMGESMDELLAYQTSQNNLQLIGLLDKEVQTADGLLAVNDGRAGTTEFTLPETADSCVVEIFDAGGRLIKTIDNGGLPAGTYELAWDGEYMDGSQAPDGVYSYEVKAADAGGVRMDVDYRTTGYVTGLQYDSGEAMLTLDNQIQVNVSDVLAVNQ